MVNNNKVNTLANAIKGLVQDKESTNNKTSSWNSPTNNTRYPTEKLVKDSLDNKANSNHTHLSSDVTDLIDTIYPIGSIYISVSNTSPSILFGGSWEQIQDRFLLASGQTYQNGSTGGSATVSLSASQMPRHNHSTNAHSHSTNTTGEYFVTSESGSANNTRVTYSSSGNRYVDGMNDNKTPFHHRSNTSNASPTTKYTGGTGSTEASSNGSAHENMPPYLTVYMWKRTA